MNPEDRVFMKHFGSVIAGLVAFTLVIVALAAYMHGMLTPSANPSREAAKLERIQPVAGVYTDEDNVQAVAAASQAPQPEPPAQTANETGSADGGQVYQQACAACHMSGAAGAPRLQPSAWADRLPQGIDTLTQHAINGYKLMPAKGGRTDLSDAQVRAAVEWMVAQVEQ